MCQIVDGSGIPVNNVIYEDYEKAKEHCNNLMENYTEYYGVRILTIK
jgi:hypothetical protein